MPDPVDSASAPPAPSTRSPRAWPDAVLAGLVLAFGFLAASFTARNSDLWLHLADGRLIADGPYHFGADPFAYTTGDAYWANHTWLTDLALYKAHAALGGSGLVALKALMVALTALLMLRTTGRAGPIWVSAGLVLLALLAMSPRMLLQPACVSLLLLALCLALFRRGGRAFVVLPFVIALWANLDEWYILGPFLVGLGCLGRWLSPSANAPRPPGWLVPACLGACLLTPYHVHGLTLPVELSPAVWASPFVDDPRFTGSFASPWRFGPLGPAGGFNLAAWAFWALVGIGLVSFAANRRAVVGWRGLVWVGFAGLAGWQARLIPFFAVVGGPIAALNFRDVMAAGFLRQPGRAFAGAFALLLTALAWPGWLQGFAVRDRGLAWAVMPDPSLEHAARVVRQWRADGTLPPDARTLATHPDLAHHLVWFCPGERVFVDARLRLFADVAGPWEAVCRSLALIPAGPGSSGGAGEGSGDLRDRGVACVLLYDPDPRRMTGAIHEISTDRGRWELMAVEGGVVAVRPAGASVSPVPRFEPVREAFGPPANESLPPAAGVTLAGEPAPIWAPRNRPRRASWEGDAAFVYLRLFEGRGAAGGKSTDRSPALPLLAIRAARMSVAASPGDDGAWLSIAQGTLYQSRATWEAEAGRGFPLLVHLRQAQVAAALVQTVVTYPEGIAGHEALAGLYGERGFLDLAARHRREQVRLIRRAGPGAGESAEAFADRLARLMSRMEEAENVLQDAENRFLIQTYGSSGDPLGRARAAIRLGLPGRALEVLTASNADLYGAEGLRLMLELLVWTGQAADARVLLERDEIRRNPDGLGAYEIPGGVVNGQPWGYRLHAHDWFDLLTAAAAGRYNAAAGAAGRLRARFQALEEGGRGPAARGAAGLLTTEAGLGSGGGWGLPYGAIQLVRLAEFIGYHDLLAAQRADLNVVEGLLHLERGATDAAAEQFDAAAQAYESAHMAPTRPGRPLGERYRAALRKTGG